MRKIYSLCALAAAMLAAPAANAFTIDEICGNYSINLTIGTPAYTISGFSSTTSGTMTIEKGTAANEITIKNFAPNQPDLTATFDEATNTVTIQPALWINNATIGSQSGYNFYICTGEITQVDGYNVVNDRKALTGTFDTDKNLTFSNWMLVDDYYDEPMSYDITSTYAPKEEEQPEEPGDGIALDEILGDYSINLTIGTPAYTINGFSSTTEGTMTIEKGSAANEITIKNFAPNQPDLTATYDAATSTITIQPVIWINNATIGSYSGYNLYICTGEITQDGTYNVVTDRKPVTGKVANDKTITFSNWMLVDDYYDEPMSYNITSVYTPTNAAIEGITADDSDINAPVEFYNLQGVRVNAETLGTGIYIRRQGSKATKIMVTK